MAAASSSQGDTDTTIAYSYDLNGYRTGKTVVTKTYETVTVHNYVATVFDPTCTEEGYTLYECACGASYQDNVVPMLGHSYVIIENDGINVTYRCTRCADTYTSPIGIIDPPAPPVSSYSSVDGDVSASIGCGTQRVLISTVTEEHSYIYASGKLLQETITTTEADGTVTTQVLDFAYDAQGVPYALTCTNGTADAVVYYYITNLQGDVMYLIDGTGAIAAGYSYDPYGHIQQTTGPMAQINPLRYRGYYYDFDTEFYYLHSRYYDAATCRFINADAYLVSSREFTGYNMFAYCGNNPTNRSDTEGNLWGIATLASAAVGGVISGVADAVVQMATTGTVDWGQTAIAAASGAISGACALIPGGKAITTALSGVINAGLSAGSYILNQRRMNKNIDQRELTKNAIIGFASGVAGNLFRMNRTSAIRDAGEELLSKGARKLANGVANSSTSTIKRAYQYFDRGAELIICYANRAGINSGFGSAVGTVMNAVIR